MSAGARGDEGQVSPGFGAPGKQDWVLGLGLGGVDYEWPLVPRSRSTDLREVERRHDGRKRHRSRRFILPKFCGPGGVRDGLLAPLLFRAPTLLRTRTRTQTAHRGEFLQVKSREK